MSRTYRNLNTKHGYPKWSMRRFSKLQVAHCNEQPEPYNVPMSLYETYIETYEVQPTDKDRIWVSKGTPMAQPEYIKVMVSFTRLNGETVSWPKTVESGRYYLMPKAEVKTRTRRRYLGPNPEFDWNEHSKRWQAQWAFNHYRKNQTGNGRSAYFRSRKKTKRKEIRLQGKAICYEALNDYKYSCSVFYDYDREICVYYWEGDRDYDPDHIYYSNDADWSDYLDDLDYDRREYMSAYDSWYSDDDHDESDIDQWEGRYDDWGFEDDFYPAEDIMRRDRLTDRDDLFEELDYRNNHHI